MFLGLSVSVSQSRPACVSKTPGDGCLQVKVLSEESVLEKHTHFLCVCEDPLPVNLPRLPDLPKFTTDDCRDIISVQVDFDKMPRPPPFLSHTLFQTLLSSSWPDLRAALWICFLPSVSVSSSGGRLPFLFIELLLSSSVCL